ncbi:Acetyl-coenzyme A synthetase 1 [Galdieria sulphuraria]|uniref:Acetoacetyl-CoA synthetase n=1 Tax=Galdieria sulphuraria TaxID=130081 RepID=M2Y7Z2_GALSU|nr:acetoacetyl-CoA synthetase [Galdieria sulphuraria]EME32193.1 acetoacetyl-CoA synthetase [Galdieria sulphuraria]GJD09617.1 Acetyl-coenzyme A synthetase 1 [Galdieria sulphuraria]|eukprot:XP_005708713.1 acetoacetyl-CoA synthetase [Galdieria sulphuraria]
MERNEKTSVKDVQGLLSGLVPFWTPSESRIKESQLYRFVQWIDRKYGLRLGKTISDTFQGTEERGGWKQEQYEKWEAIYEELHQWSIEHLDDFWSAVWDFMDVKASKRMEHIRLPRENSAMPRVRWFVGAKCNLAENLLRFRGSETALIFRSEDPNYPRVEWTFSQLYDKVFYFWKGLLSNGITKGDMIVGYVPNMLETAVAALGTIAMGATWASCSPDFGVQAVVERFGQIKPKVLVASDGYFFKGKVFNSIEKLKEIVKELKTLKLLIIIPYIHRENEASWKSANWGIPCHSFDEFGKLESSDSEKVIHFEQVSFDHPCYIMFSSGTTGLPKCLVQGTGVLLNQMKEHQLHCDFKPKQRLLYFTTCGWMMWNWQLAALASNICLVIYDGSPLPPQEPYLLFRILDEEQVTYFGTSARFLQAVEEAGVNPFRDTMKRRLKKMDSMIQSNTQLTSHQKAKWRHFLESCSPHTFQVGSFPRELEDLLEQDELLWLEYQRTTYWPSECIPFYYLDAILVTGSPSSPLNFAYVYNQISPRARYLSISGGTEINGCFGNGCILKRIFAPELQCRGLGMDIRIFNDQGQSVIGQEGELVCCTPVPSMPLYLWNDNEFKKYTETYFDKYPGIWRHGDFATMTERYSLNIKGRSDATMNPGGVRIGSAEIYHVVSSFAELEDCVVVGQHWHGDERIIMFVKLKENTILSEDLIQRIRQALREKLSPRHVPAKVLSVPEIPYTVNNKKVEIAVKRVIEGLDVPNKGAIQNPECLEYYRELAKRELQ